MGATLNVVLIVVGWVLARAAARLHGIPEDRRPAFLQGPLGSILQLVAMLAGVTLVIWGVAGFF